MHADVCLLVSQPVGVHSQPWVHAPAAESQPKSFATHDATSLCPELFDSRWLTGSDRLMGQATS